MRPVNLVGDRFDTQAGKIIADADLDEMRGSVLANLQDSIADALRAAREGALAEAIEAEEAGWVIERGDSDPAAPFYYDGLGWTADHNLAIRHARKIDAELVAVGLDGPRAHRICEHIWTTAA